MPPFELLSAIANIEVIARGKGVRIRSHLWRIYGHGKWRKLKGTATVRMADGTVCIAELHWYEAHGIGKRDMRVKRALRRL